MFKRLSRHNMLELIELRRKAAFETANFDTFEYRRVLLVNADHPEFDKLLTVDQFVKETTRVYRETWVLPIIDRFLAWGRGE